MKTRIMKSKYSNRYSDFLATSLSGCLSKKEIREVQMLSYRMQSEFSERYGDSKSKGKLAGMTVDVWDDKDDKSQVVSAALRDRKPIDWGPKPRKPTRCGGESCWTIKIGRLTIRICIIYEGPCKVKL